MHNRTRTEMDTLRNLLQEFLMSKEMMDDWNEWHLHVRYADDLIKFAFI